jgi:CubicO group peptidase (beta-lactamase class C family)
MNATICLLSFLISGFPGPAYTLAKPAKDFVQRQTIREKLDQYISEFTGVDAFSGVVLVSSSDSIQFNKGYGKANYEWNIPNTTKSRFRIASLSKAFTAVLVLQMVEKGMISLNSTISDCLPYFPSVYGDSITVHQLLCHTSGIPHYNAVPDFDPLYTRIPVSSKEYIKMIAGLKLLFPPGTKYHYSSFGYYLLGAILEWKYGLPYSEILRQNILAPAGMNETAFDDMNEIRPNRASGYNFDQSGILNSSFEDTYKSIGCGGIISTTPDMFLWIKALKSGLALSDSSRNLVFKRNLGSYGYGWILRDINNNSDNTKHIIAWHLGSDFGFASYISLDLTGGDCIIVLSNLETAPVKDIGEGVHRICTGLDPRIPSGRQFIRVHKSIYSACIGRYSISEDYYIDILEGKHGLLIQWTGLNSKLLLFPASEDSYFIRENEKLFTFTRNREGNVISLSFLDKNDKITGIKIL